MKKYIIFSFILLIASSSCQRLDDFLYNESKLDHYSWDAYQGEVDFTLDESQKIPDSLMHSFTLLSQTQSESTPTTIYALYIGSLSRIASDTVIMYCHGNYDHMDFYWQRAKLLANIGSKNRFGVLMIDYRGFGMSEGKSTEDGLYADVDAALSWLKQHGLSDNRLMMYGFSLGSAPATELTANIRSMKPSRLILEAPFASAEVLVQDGSALSIPGSFLTNLKIDNAEEIKKVNQPFLWMHGTKDAFLSIKTHGEIVYKNYHGLSSKAFRIEGAGHSTVPQTMGFESYKKILESFICGK